MDELSTLRVLDRLTLPCLLGMRFWDTAAGTLVENGLQVEARNARGVFAGGVQNRSGVWHFPRLPGISSARLAEAEAQGGPAAGPSSLFTISVYDGPRLPPNTPLERRLQTAVRFLPVEFDVLAPVEGGLFHWPHGGVELSESSPPITGPVPLFATASRSAPPGRLSVYADLWDVEGERPAAWALLEVTAPGMHGTDTFLGLADAQGAVALFLPTPAVPVAGTRVPAAERSWTVGVQVSYAPALTIDRFAHSPPSLAASSAPLPMLDAILAQRAEAAATVFATRLPDTALTSASLRVSEPLLLRTAAAGLEPRLQSHLLVQSRA